MDWRPISLEPNLKFVSELKDDLKQKYYELHEAHNQFLANFTRDLNNIYHDYQNIASDRVELLVTVEKLKKENVSNKKPDMCNKIDSEVISASVNCKLEVTPKALSINKKLENKICNDNISGKKQVCEYVPIFTADFDSDVEEIDLKKSQSPPRPAVNSSEKVHDSPILSKSKRHGSKKNNSLVSNNSITSSNDSKLNLSITPKNPEKNNETNGEDNAKLEKNINRVPLHGIENNICTTPKSKHRNVLSVSKFDYGKTEFLENGKKLRQSKLTLKKVIPIIDISKVDSSESPGNQCTQNKSNSNWDQTFFINQSTNASTSNKKNNDLKKNLNYFYERKECIAENNAINQNVETKNKSEDEGEDELIETSPNSETSKLRNKLNKIKPGIKKLEIRQTVDKISHNSTNKRNSKLLTVERKSTATDKNCNNLKTNFKNFSKPSTSEQNNMNAVSNKISSMKKKQFLEGEKVSRDETFFSPAEVIDKISDAGLDIDFTDFEDNLSQESPPVKKILLSSFDVVPNKKDNSPNYAYKEAPVRKKAVRAQLPGWSCRDCERYYNAVASSQEKRIRQNMCSRHRGKFKANNGTPDSFWNPEFDDDDINSSSVAK